MKVILLDMDGTLADFYGQEHWLRDINAFDTSPYRKAKPLWNMQELCYEMSRLVSKGYLFNIVSWCSRTGTPEYNKKVSAVKRSWLKKYCLPLNKINIVKYGTDKTKFKTNDDDIIIDDEHKNRKGFKYSVDPTQENVVEFLRSL
jgi:hypothetical protein